MVDCDNEKISITRQAELLSLNRTSLYYKPVGVSDEELRLRRRIDEIYTERPVSGSRYITAILRREGWLINRKRVVPVLTHDPPVGLRLGRPKEQRSTLSVSF